MVPLCVVWHPLPSIVFHAFSTHPSCHIYTVYLPREQPRFIQKRMACQPCRDIYGRRHASSRVLTARAGRMAIPTPSLECDKKNEWSGIRRMQEIRRFPGYRSRFAPVNSAVPAVTWPDVGQTWGGGGFW